MPANSSWPGSTALIERRATGTTGESRAPGIQSRTLEVFRQRGLATKFEEIGRPLPAVVYAGLPIHTQHFHPAWPEGLIAPQTQTERILAERAVELGVPILWSTELVSVEQDAQQVTALVRAHGDLKACSANYLVGCDGGHSATRRLGQISFPGEDPLSHWLVADVQLDAPPGQAGIFGHNTKIGTYQVARTEPGWFRVSLMTLTPPVDRAAPVTIEELRSAMIEGLGTDYGLSHARWLSRYSDGCRQVERYRHGRIFLAGDAAHIHSPVGGQGLNLGLQDAYNLGWKLAAVVKHGARDALLDSYHDERHPTARRALQMTRAQTALIKPGPQIDALREEVAGMLAQPATALDMAGRLSGLALRYAWGEGQHPLVGCRMPDLQLRTPHAPNQRLYDLMACGRPLLLCLGGAALDIPEAWRDRVERVDASLADDAAWDLPVFGRVPALDAAFIRPDGYVAWVSEAGRPQAETLAVALDRWLG